MSEHRLHNRLLCVALTGGSVTRSRAGDCTLTWLNETGGRSTLYSIVDVAGPRAPAENQDATWLVENAKRMGVLVIDYKGCNFDDVCHWVIKGPMMLEPGEKMNPLDAELFKPGSCLSKLPPYEWCLQAVQAVPGLHISNIPAPDAVPGEHNIHLQEVRGVPRGWDNVETSHD